MCTFSPRFQPSIYSYAFSPAPVLVAGPLRITGLTRAQVFVLSMFGLYLTLRH